MISIVKFVLKAAYAARTIGDPEISLAGRHKSMKLNFMLLLELLTVESHLLALKSGGRDCM